ncbi:MAG: hypothetical protein M1838_003570 [Thelocarpon superellum]|nr:MAG: hypothetical protein M1838_003570 [Thelocarpon superellum]
MRLGCIALLLAVRICLVQGNAIRVIFHNATLDLRVTHKIKLPTGQTVDHYVHMRPVAAYDWAVGESQCLNSPAPFQQITFLNLHLVTPGSVITAYAGRTAVSKLSQVWRAGWNHYLPFLPLGCSGRPISQVVGPNMTEFTMTGHHFTGAAFFDIQANAAREGAQLVAIESNLIVSAMLLSSWYAIRISRHVIQQIRRMPWDGQLRNIARLQPCLRMLHPRGLEDAGMTEQDKPQLDEEQQALEENGGLPPPDQGDGGNHAQKGTNATTNPSTPGGVPGECPALGVNYTALGVNYSALQPDQVHVFPQRIDFGNLTLFRQPSPANDSSFHLNYASADGLWTLPLL